MDVDEEELCSFPVFLSQDLAQSLYLLQYPLRPAERPYEEDLGMSASRSPSRQVRVSITTLALWRSPGKLTNVRVKPIHNKLEFAYQLDVDSDNFDLSSEQHTDALRLGSRAVPLT